MYFFYLNGTSYAFVQRNNFDYYKIINDVIIKLLKQVYLNFSNNSIFDRMR